MVWRTGTRRCCAQASPQRSEGARCGPFYKKGDHLRPGNWRTICCAVTEANLVWMVVFGRIQRRLYAAGVIPDNLWGCVSGRSTGEAFVHICQTGGGYENLINPGGASSKAIRVSRVFSGSGLCHLKCVSRKGWGCCG